MPDIKGYRDLTEQDINYVNIIKDGEINLGRLWRAVSEVDGVDKRWLAVAKTHFQEGFTALVRSVTQPEDVY